MTDYSPYESPEWLEDQRRKDVLMRAAAEEAAEGNPLDGVSTADLELMALNAVRPDNQRENDLLSYDAAERFVDAHAEYITNQRNGQLMIREVERLGLDTTQPESFERAFRSLQQDNLVEIDYAAAAQLRSDVREQRRSRRVGALSAKHSTPNFYSDEQEPNYDRMTSAELQERAYRAAAEGKF
jgi:hypothetical protein